MSVSLTQAFGPVPREVLFLLSPKTQDRPSGLGEAISQATASGNFPLLLAATSVMSLLVVLTNRLVWRPLYRLAQ